MATQSQMLLHLDGVAPDLAEDLARSLRADLLQIGDVKAAEPGKRPESGGKTGLESIDWNTLLITLLGSGGVVVTVVTAIQAWLLRHKEASVTVKLGEDEMIIKGSDPEGAKQLTDAFLKHHKGSPTAHG